MLKLSTNLSSRRHSAMSLQELNDGFLRSWTLLPYSMHYWYFNVIDPVDGFTSSYILARSNVEITFNGRKVNPEPDLYTAVYIDFHNEFTEVIETRVTICDNMLKSPDLDFGLLDNKIYFRFRDRAFSFDKILPDCYRANFFELYEWYSLNCSSGSSYLIGNNAVIRGPLAPWNWLHFYFEDGTHVKVFSAVGQHRVLQLNNTSFPLTAVTNDKDTVTYTAGDPDCFFELVLQKGFSVPSTYKPRWSSTWQYDQIGVTLKSVRSNIPDFNTNQNGKGILELTRGFSL